MIDRLEGQTVINDVLYRYKLYDDDDLPLSLQIYLGVARFGHLWEQEVRVLVRASALDHPALPTVIDGGYRDQESVASKGLPFAGFAYVITRSSEHVLADAAEAVPYMLQYPSEAVRQLYLLADGLASLHALDLVHRNLWPGTVEVRMDNGRPRLQMTRFEMSRFVDNLLRAPLDRLSGGAAARNAFLEDPRALAYRAPEQHDPTRPGDSQKADVYSLAAMAWEWFFGRLPDTLTDAEPERIAERARALNERMRREVRTARHLPAPLCSLLDDMLTPDPRSRPSAGEVVHRIGSHYKAMTGLWADDGNQRPYLLTFVPHEYHKTLLNWEWVTHDPNSREGRRELADVIERDLHRARMIYAPHGADPFVAGGERKAKREAVVLLLGRRAAWFCRQFSPPSAFGGAAEPLDDVLIILYVARRHTGRVEHLISKYQESGFEQTVNSVKAVPYDIGRSALDRYRSGSPKWTPLIEAILPSAERSSSDQAFEGAFDWLLEYQAVVARSREYAYELLDEGTRRQVRIQLDRARDDERRLSTPMSAKFTASERRRPAFADFFEAQEEDEEDTLDLEVLEDHEGRPREVENPGRVLFVEKLAEDAILVERKGDTPRIPAKGWIRPARDRGDRVSQSRQRDGRWELSRNKLLVRQLQNPVTIRGLSEPWERMLDPETEGAAIDMLVNQPLYALQGPPGTGKTTTSAKAIRAFLSLERTGRVLVSAQSNYALDHLALKIISQLDEDDHICLRVTTESSKDRVKEEVRPYLLDASAERRRKRLVAAIKRRLQDPGGNPAHRPILGEWLTTAEDAAPELADRMARSASVVFATCSAASPAVMSPLGMPELFDWVLVEEAAKAWPTELIIPLNRGIRWTLVGDQNQLSAHRLEDVTRFLEECRNAPDPEIRIDGEHASDYRKVFRMFAALFSKDEPTTAGLSRATGMLVEQRRMVPIIGDLVSKIFYTDADLESLVPGRDELPPGRLVSKRVSPSVRLSAPAAIAGGELVWLDTSDHPERGDRPLWENELEAQVVADLVERLRPVPEPKRHGYGERPFAVLTPYRRQERLLKGYGTLTPHVSTIHAFQGQEADVVVASLVRDTRRQHSSRPTGNIGHLSNPELVNVLFSRARDCLILVGSFRHFAENGTNWWRWICAEVEAKGRIVPVSEVLRQ